MRAALSLHRSYSSQAPVRDPGMSELLLRSRRKGRNWQKGINSSKGNGMARVEKCLKQCKSNYCTVVENFAASVH